MTRPRKNSGPNHHERRTTSSRGPLRPSTTSGSRRWNFDANNPRHSFSIDRAMQIINDAGRGIIVMLRRAETDADLLRHLSDPASHTPAARWDARTFGIGAQILRALNVRKMRLLANPRKIPSMAGFDLELTGYKTD